MDRLSCGLIELKFAEAGTETMTFSGYGAVFNNIDSYGDVIMPGAFAQYLNDVKSGKTPWPAMLAQHGGWGMAADDLTPVGVWTDLAEDGHGLKVDGQLADTPRGRELHALMKMSPRPAIDGLSIGYIPKEWEPRSKPEDPKRRLKRIELVEISPVTFPANGQARVKDVKAIEEIATLRDAEEFLRASGLSKSAAVALISRIKSALGEPARSDGPGDPVVAEVSALIRRNVGVLQTRR